MTSAHSPGEMLVINSLHGVRLYALADDPRAAALSESHGDFNPMSTALWRSLFESQTWDLVIDIGANYGEMVLAFSLASSTVWALEPSPSIVTCLRRSVAESERSIEVMELAAGSTTGPTQLYHDPQWSGTSTTTPEAATTASRPVLVSQIRLDELLARRERGPGERVLVKIDVEGGEREVLKGFGATINEMASFAAFIEILHASDDDLEWLSANYFLHLLTVDGAIAVPVVDAADYWRRRASDLFYLQDAVVSTGLLSPDLSSTSQIAPVSDGELALLERCELIRRAGAVAMAHIDALRRSRDDVHAQPAIETPHRRRRAWWRKN